MHPGQKPFLPGFPRESPVSAEANPRKSRNTGFFGGFCAGKLYLIRRNDVRWDQRLIRSGWKSFLICTQNRKCTQTSQLIITSHSKIVKTKKQHQPGGQCRMTLIATKRISFQVYTSHSNSIDASHYRATTPQGRLSVPSRAE